MSFEEDKKTIIVDGKEIDLSEIKLTDFDAIDIESMGTKDIDNADIYIKALLDKHYYNRAIRLFNKFENRSSYDNYRSYEQRNEFNYCNSFKTMSFMASLSTYPKTNQYKPNRPDKRVSDLYLPIGLAYKQLNDYENFEIYANKAIENKNYDAYAHLGLSYLTRDEANKIKALKYFKIAEEKGSKYIYILLAELYFYGIYGFEKNIDVAVDYLQQADPNNEYVINLKKKISMIKK